jgi:hypothetical protein
MRGVLKHFRARFRRLPTEVPGSHDLKMAAFLKSENVHFSDFRKEIREILGRKTKVSSKDIFFNIATIELAIKPAYLFDQAPIDCEKLEKLHKATTKSLLLFGLGLGALVQPTTGPGKVERVGINTLLESALVFSVNDNVFCCNPTLLEQLLEEQCQSGAYTAESQSVMPVIVDASSELEKPCLMANSQKEKIVSDMIQFINLNLSDSKACDAYSGASNLASLSCPSSINQSTLFGFLLGYPVLYWYSSIDPSDCRTCLDMCPLVVTSILCDHNDDTHCVYSFSFPEHLKCEIEQCIFDWFSEFVVKRFERQNFFTNLRLCQATKTLTCVAL